MKYTILFCLSLCIFSCGPIRDCDSTVEYYRVDECLLIVQKIPSDTDSRFDYKGINPVTKKEYDCNSNISDMWWSNYKKDITIGDTIIKKKGELIFSIHKKDTVMSFNFECEGKIYK
ncbi:hypothetical protein [Flavobacterium sp. AJR]|uniref:hypothetical protein n=1 Tax=Flavobacterium sp. AJR TaxID=1979369 RepID=UPI000A3D65F6|nr:hypothetical protein [Flavobacterium sp. AJR]OUL59835.1 hypothetical protein B8T70_23515 [Flavobacterium sp. AJR]